MATHSSTLAWKTPWTEEPSGLQSMGLQSRIGLSDFTFTLKKTRKVGSHNKTGSCIIVSGCGLERGMGG